MLSSAWYSTPVCAHIRGYSEIGVNPGMVLTSLTIGVPVSETKKSTRANPWHSAAEAALWSCAHGAGRQLSRTDTLKFWHSLKKAEKDAYRQRFPELLNRQGDFDSSILQEFDFAYKDSAALLATQPYLICCDETRPIATVKFTGV